MKASDLYRLISERDNDAMGKVSYKNDKTPDNHVKGKKSREVDPLPDPGKKRDERNPAKVGDVKKKEQRSMEGPMTGAKKVTEQGPHELSSRRIQAQPAAGVTPGEYGQLKGSPQQAQMMGLISQYDGPGGTAVIQNKATGGQVRVQMDPRELATKIRTMTKGADVKQAGIIYKELLNHPSAQPVGGGAGQAAPSRRATGPAGAGRNVGQAMSPQQVSQAGSGWALEGRRVAESGIENAGSMSKKPAVKQGGPCCKTASVRSAKQNDEPKPTAQVGTPKKKEKRSMDANTAPVKDFKGGSNEHKKMGVHEGMKDLERLLHRKIRTPFLSEQSHDDLLKYTASQGHQFRPDRSDLDEALKGYLETILYAETDESDESGGQPLDKNYDIKDFAPESIAQAKKEVAAFLKAAAPYLNDRKRMDLVGYCFWLNRVGHGTGFWDREEEFGEQQAEALSDLATNAGHRDAMVGDDGKIYIERG